MHLFISTHTPLAGRDDYAYYFFPLVNISTHTPLAGRDRQALHNPLYNSEFLLTRPSRDVTKKSMILYSALAFLLTRPSRDVTRL